MTGPGVDAPTPPRPVPIRWGLGDFAWAWPATDRRPDPDRHVRRRRPGRSPSLPRRRHRHRRHHRRERSAHRRPAPRTSSSTRGGGSLRADLGLTVRARRLALGGGRRRAPGGRPGRWCAAIESVAGSEPKQEVVAGDPALGDRGPDPRRGRRGGLRAGGRGAPLPGPAAAGPAPPLRRRRRRCSIGGVTFAAVHLLDPSAAPLLAPARARGGARRVLACAAATFPVDPAPRRFQPAERRAAPHDLKAAGP